MRSHQYIYTLHHCILYYNYTNTHLNSLHRLKATSGSLQWYSRTEDNLSSRPSVFKRLSRALLLSDKFLNNANNCTKTDEVWSGGWIGYKYGERTTSSLWKNNIHITHTEPFYSWTILINKMS